MGPLSRRNVLRRFGAAGAAALVQRARALNAFAPAEWIDGSTLGIRPLHVGPIVGHTSDRHVRLWGAGVAPDRAGESAFGVAQLFQGERMIGAGYFPLLAGLDSAGAIDFADVLEPATTYEYRMGQLLSSRRVSDLPDPRTLALDGLARHRFRSGRSAQDDRCCFVFGSCRRLMFQANGAPVPGHESDGIFAAIAGQMGERETDAVLMLGDQIYADLGGGPPVLKRGRSEEAYFRGYCDRYRASFGTPAMARLLASVPTYMILDDHEIGNDFTLEKASRNEHRRRQFRAAMQAYRAYQELHGPTMGDHRSGALEVSGHLPSHYAFRLGSVPFFVMDTRSQRTHTLRGRPEVVDAVQLQALCGWLKRHADRLKFVVSSVPFFPDILHDAAAKALGIPWDGWNHFHEQRREILDLFLRERVRRTVFLGGDVHTSAYSRLDYPGGRAYSIVSSPFWLPGRASWPRLFFLQKLRGAPEGFQVRRPEWTVGQNNFARMTWEGGAALELEYFDERGARLRSATLQLDP